MRNAFRQFHTPSSSEIKRDWKDALIIFDTNVLLNLYSYQDSTKDEMLGILDKLSERIWLPYQVALEYQRDRLEVIRKQIERYNKPKSTIKAETQKILSLKDNIPQHGYTEICDIFDKYSKMEQETMTKLELLEKNQLQSTARDPIKSKLEELFNGKVGAPIQSQAASRELLKL